MEPALPSSPLPRRRFPTLLFTTAALLALALGARPVPAISPRATPLPLPDDDGARSAPGLSPFLLRGTDVKTVITGPVAHTIVRQQWVNPNRGPVEGIYVFPLPENAAVTAMRLVIGTREIEGGIRRREEARAVYEQARQQGKIAGLLDQERPNVFAQRVANIMPGMPIQVVLEMDQEIPCDGGDCEYVFPTVVGPRFVPCRLPDPGLIDPPVTAPGTTTGQRLTFEATLDVGVEISDLRSPSHRVRIDPGRSGHALASFSGDADDLAAGDARLDRDVRLQWRLGGAQPQVGVLAWRDPRAPGEPGVFTVMVAPPAGVADDDVAASRELVFVLDCSGSMRGAPIEAVKNVVRTALGALRPGDTFQIIRFSDHTSGLGAAPLAPTTANLRQALAYLDGLHGEGGTEMLSGIRAALDRPADPERLRIVAFLTDGYIGNEAEILGETRRLIGDARLFAFGIGSSVNRYLLENLAQEGRGAAAFLGPRETPDAMVQRFVERIATPVLTDVHLSWESIDVDDQEPAAVPDLFAGRPLVVHGRYRVPGAGALVVQGRLRGRVATFRCPVTLPSYAADHEALARLWARARIDRLTREEYGRPRPDVVEAATALGLRFHLMTPWTSLVAVDHDASSYGPPAGTVMVPVEMPQDVSYEGIFGNADAKVATAYAAPQNGPALQAERFREQAGGPDTYPEARHKVYRDPAARGDAAVRGPAPEADFVSLTLVEEDGTRRIVEDDGEAWLVAEPSRRLVRTLTGDRLAAIREALRKARPDDWPAGDATFARGRSRLVLLTSGAMTRSVGLPAGDPLVDALVTLVREATSY